VIDQASVLYMIIVLSLRLNYLRYYGRVMLTPMSCNGLHTQRRFLSKAGGSPFYDIRNRTL
jgi:hypothetical protein